MNEIGERMVKKYKLLAITALKLNVSLWFKNTFNKYI